MKRPKTPTQKALPVGVDVKIKDRHHVLIKKIIKDLKEVKDNKVVKDLINRPDDDQLGGRDHSPNAHHPHVKSLA